MFKVTIFVKMKNKTENIKHQKEKEFNLVIRRTHLTSLVVVLMIITSIVTSTIYQPVQVLCEVLFIIVIGSLILKEKVGRDDFTLLMIFLFSQTVSFFLNDFSTFALNAKQFGMAVFSLIYFKKCAPNSKLIHLAFVATASLVILQYFHGEFPFDVKEHLGTLKGHTDQRPLGLFLSFHYSAFFMATYLLGYTIRKRTYGTEVLLLFLSGTRTSLIAYLGQRVIRIISNRLKYFRSWAFQMAVSFAIIGAVSIFYRIALELFLYLDFGVNSVTIILHQIGNIEKIIDVHLLFPTDFFEHNMKFSNALAIEGHDGGNELGFITILVQGGILLSFAFILKITRCMKSYRVFIVIGLLHHTYVLSPLIIFTMFMFEHREQRREVKKLNFYQMVCHPPLRCPHGIG